MPQGRRVNRQIDFDGFRTISQKKLQCKFVGFLVFDIVDIFYDKDY